MPNDKITDLDAVTLRDRIATGALSALDVTEAYLARIAEKEPEVRAWVWHDPDHARAQAQALDAQRVSGAALGGLHGIPIGLKDVIATAGIPTQNGTPNDAGHVPDTDAFVVAQLKAAGAVIMGKTTTTELAFLRPTETRNPHNPLHTPGGSSAGSAAAVAAGMVPLAVGTQTGGSVIRPASFCGTVGFKPTFGAIPRSGVTMQSHTLDTLGVFATSPGDAAMIAECLFGCDASDPATGPRPRPQLLQATRTAPLRPPVFAFVHPPGWEDADADMREALADLAHGLGEQVFEVDLPAGFETVAEMRALINFAEMSKHYARYRPNGWHALSEHIQGAMTAGEAASVREYLIALDQRQGLYKDLGCIFERADAILCPAAPGAAPADLSTTGDAIFNGLWTYMGTPAVTLPVLTSPSGMPIGAQLVAPRGNDARLMGAAQWLWAWTKNRAA
ncbi:amidase [Tropicimonas sp. S265A]|uniref:amidase n=1 Tax=Tropicimonas sp. S265A TaxID=3415134 RepID=UPI003C7997F2